MSREVQDLSTCMSARCDTSRTSHTTNNQCSPTQNQDAGGGAKEAQREKREENSKANVPKDLRFSMDINSDVPGFLVGKRKVERGEVDEPAAAKGDGL